MIRAKKILVVGINENIHSVRRILEEIKKENIPSQFIDWGSIVFKNGYVYHKNNKLQLARFKAVFFEIPSYILTIKSQRKKKFLFRLNNELIELTRLIKKERLFLLNKDFILEYPFYNKFTQAQIFSKNKIPDIPTLHLTDNKPLKVMAALQKNNFHFPVVIKESLGGMGQNVWKAENEEDLKKVIQDKRNVSLIFQPFIKNGGDYRVLVIRGSSLGIMHRVAQKKEWKNNFALGGKIEKFTDPEMEKFAENVAKKMKIDYAGIDIFKIGKKYHVIEVNMFAAFEGFEKAYPKINVAKNIINYLKK